MPTAEISWIQPRPGESTYRHQADALALVISSNALSPRVEGQNPIHEERVAVMAVFQFHVEQPAAVGHLFHGMGDRVPPIEVTDQAHGLGLRRAANKVNRSQGLLISEGSHSCFPIWFNF